MLTDPLPPLRSLSSLCAVGALVCKRVFESVDAKGLERRARRRDEQVDKRTRFTPSLGSNAALTFTPTLED